MNGKAGCLCASVILMLGGGVSWGATETAVTISSAVSGEQIPATLRTPDGSGPFPAVVIMHDCSGLSSRSSGAPGRWANELVPQGYVVLIPDSFTPRGMPAGVCTEPPDRSRVADGEVRAADAYGALAYLRSLPDVDGRHIGIMGGSHGGWTVMSAMYEPVLPTNPLTAVKQDGFAAAIALYPSCSGPYGAWATGRVGRTGPIVTYAGVYKPIAPVLILIGEKDDWTPAEPCKHLAEAAQQSGYPVSMKVYPGAFHSFDSFAAVRFDPRRTNANSLSGHGATTGGDATAWADAKQQVAAFFGRYLRGN
ncbi:MAG: dienelactone hydrolase family protein [Alphaproteobacteria bacterium]|nr:dienelactone hydrolase family protein [Alphaproteobacteria bacterium]